MEKAASGGTTVIVLPNSTGLNDLPDKVRRWLDRGRISRCDAAPDPLPMVLDEIGIPWPLEGLAALRYWGQTGERPTGWIVAADPAHIELRLNDVVVHPPGPAAPAKAEVDALIGTVREYLDGRGGLSLEVVDGLVYLRSEKPQAAPQGYGTLPTCRSIAQMAPAESEGNELYRLLNDVQMLLHEHPVNQRRAASGLLPVNSLWLWGAGNAPGVRTIHLPPLIADDPLMVGFWKSCSIDVTPWQSDELNIMEQRSRVLVAVTAQRHPLGKILSLLQRACESGRSRKMKLLFRDGLRVEVGPLDRFRFWRRKSGVIDRFIKQ